MDGGQTVTIQNVSTTYQPVTVLFDNESMVAGHETAGNNAYFTFTAPQSGLYFLATNSFPFRTVGEYRLRVLEGEVTSPCAPQGSVSLGGSTSGSHTEWSCISATSANAAWAAFSVPVVRDFYEFTLTEQTMVVLVGNGNGTSLPVTEIFSGSVASDVGLTSTAKIGGLRTTEAKEVRTPVLLAAGNYVMAVGAAGADANSLPELGAYTVSLESRTEDNHLACFTGTYFIGRGISTNQTLESGDCEFSTGPGESTRLDSYIIRSSGGGSVTYSVESLTPGLDVQLMAWRDGQFDVPLHQSILGTNLSGTFTLPFGQPWVQIQVVTRSPTNGAPPAAGNYRLTIN